jgi:hypothetical protein
MLKENGKFRGDVIYVPSPVKVLYNYIYSIEVNKSGRLQYFRQPVNKKRKRITKTEFSRIYNTKKILAIDPIQKNEFDNNHFLLKFYTI